MTVFLDNKYSFQEHFCVSKIYILLEITYTRTYKKYTWEPENCGIERRHSSNAKVHLVSLQGIYDLQGTY